MSIREYLNNRAGLATGGAIVILLVTLGVIALQMRGPSTPGTDVYFWDVEENEAFAATNQPSPMTAPSGNEGVRAYLYTCGECTADEWFGYLRKRTEEYYEFRENVPMGYGGMSPDEQDAFEFRTDVVRPLDGDYWVPYDSRRGEQIRENVLERCGPDTEPVECLP